MTIGEKIKKRRQELGLSVDELAKRIGKNRATVYRYESEEIMKLPSSVLVPIAEALDIKPSFLISDDDEPNNIPFGFQPLPKMKKVPRLGAISCGEPLMTEENFEGYDSVPENISCDFTLKCEGDSMIGARILDGDIVYIKQQPIVESGEIAAVLVDGDEKLLKRVYITQNSITLQAENPKYPPLVFVAEEMNRVSIIGKAVGFYSHIK